MSTGHLRPTADDPAMVHRSGPSSPAPKRGLRVRWRADLVIVGSGLFLVLTIIAMVVFRGGASYDLDADHYLFFGNYFSDLGGLRTYSGRDNVESRRFFTLALVLVGSSVALFGPTWRGWVRRRDTPVLGATATLFAALSGLGFIAIAFAPWDRYLDTHDAIVRGTFGMLSAFIVCLSVIQARNGAARTFIGANVLYLVALAGYGLVQLLGPSVDTRTGLQIQVTVQKLIVYASILDLGLQAWGVRSSRR